MKPFKAILSHLLAMLFATASLLVIPSCMGIRLIDSRSLSQYDASLIGKMIETGVVALDSEYLLTLSKPTYEVVTEESNGTRWAEYVFDNGKEMYIGYTRDARWIAMRHITHRTVEWVFRDKSRLDQYFDLIRIRAPTMQSSGRSPDNIDIGITQVILFA